MPSSAVLLTVVTAALAGTALVAPAAAAESSHLLVVEGTSSSFVDFEVEEQLHLDLDAVTIAGGRSYAAVHISSLDADAPYAVSAVRATWLSSDAHAFGSTLPPGKYRARLLSDGPARAAFPVESDAAGRVLRTSSPLQVTRAVAQQEVAPGRSQVRLRAEDAVPAGWHALLGVRVTGDRVEQTAACVTAGARCPSLPAAPPVVEEPDNPFGVPSRSTDMRASVARPAAEVRDALLEVDGYRTTSGRLRSLVLAFRDASPSAK